MLLLVLSLDVDFTVRALELVVVANAIIGIRKRLADRTLICILTRLGVAKVHLPVTDDPRVTNLAGAFVAHKTSIQIVDVAIAEEARS